MSTVTSSVIFAAAQRYRTETASTSQTLKNNGVSLLNSSAAADLAYSLAAPVAGCVKVLLNSGASTGQTVSSTAAGATIVTTGGSTGAATLTFPHGASAILVGQSTGKWNLVASYGAIVPA